MSNPITYCLDANVLITSWYQSYPPDLFPCVWKLLAYHQSQLVIPQPIFDEIEPYSNNAISQNKRKEKYPLKCWLEEKDFHPQKVPGAIADAIEKKAFELGRTYETGNSKGAGQNDILLIAFAERHGHTIVTLEADQPQEPSKKSDYRIPLICKKEGVPWIGFFVDLLRKLKEQKQ